MRRATSSGSGDGAEGDGAHMMAGDAAAIRWWGSGGDDTTPAPGSRLFETESVSRAGELSLVMREVPLLRKRWRRELGIRTYAGA